MTNAAGSYGLAVAVVVLGLIAAKFYLWIARKISEWKRVDKNVSKIYELPVSIIIFIILFNLGLSFVVLPANASKFLTQTTIFIAAVLVAWMVGLSFEVLLRKQILFGEEIINVQLVAVFGGLIKVTAIAIVAITVLTNFGYDAMGILAGFGVFGLAVGIAVSDVLRNVIGGIFIGLTQPFAIGDVVDVEGTRGRVEKITLLFTSLRDESGNVITIPNSKMKESRITTIQPKVEERPKLSEEIVLHLPYSVTTSQMSRLTKAILCQIKATRGCANPSIKTTLSDKINLRIAYEITDVPKANSIRNRVNMKVKRELEKEKIFS